MDLAIVVEGSKREVREMGKVGEMRGRIRLGYLNATGGKIATVISSTISTGLLAVLHP